MESTKNHVIIAIQKSLTEWKAKKEKRLNKDSDGEEEDEEDIYAVVEVKIIYYSCISF